MIEEQEAISIAMRFLQETGVEPDVESFNGARLVDGVWAVVFLRKQPPDMVISSGFIIVNVDPETGAANFFETL